MKNEGTLMNHETHMKHALELAQKGNGYTSPNPMVGAVIVKGDKIVGKGYHEAYGKAHAEVNALIDAGENAKGATLYVTLEPCNHTGKTPPCTQAILNSGINKVVMAMSDPNPHVAGCGAEFLKQNGVPVISGVCENEAKHLNRAFCKFIKTGRPLVTMKYASTMDGRIATISGDARWISNKKSRHYVHQLRHANDAILVGIGTVKNDNPSLTTRLPDIAGKDPTRIIVDTHLSIDPNAKVLTQVSLAETVLACSHTAAKERGHIYQMENVRVLPVATHNTSVNLDSLMTALGKMNKTSILIEGGSRIHSSAIMAGIVDDVCCFIAPKILGGNGYPVCQGDSPLEMKNAFPVHNIRITQFDDDILIQGELNY
ncbi:MAG: diaminohydroxyphosphoribosylaminopyrimidine deaminase [Candidatus Magnetoglobus multicellularis str. Araruama]|uniref:Riboflavin biosynthesis protein RibD n=1 Tax=Candidatus Magnetoglobus multicellularis str. Araruama TaxID=890399 RepID=A0A1V1P571_9BACT|nr:MAG: diaminohydroxyphosphoribosylaminopyrimidine deaminase [Candidatus Magnetoglobus multicellularis str. Araruama]